MLSKIIQTGIALMLLITTTIATNSPHHIKEIQEQLVNLTRQDQTLGVQDGYFPVIEVVDGDTIKVEIEGKLETVRLLGINTPETVDPRRPVECFGQEASNRARELLDGKNVRLESDNTQSNRDRYNRLLRYVFLEDGTHINKKLIEEGFAQEFTYDSVYKYQIEFKEAEKKAQESNKGLWNSENCAN